MRLNRFVYAVTGVVMLLFAGVVYAWSVISSPIAKEFVQWSSTQLSLTFTLCMVFFCLGGFLSGLAAGKIKAKLKLYLSALLFIIGFFIASKAQSLAALYMGYGVLCGLASGLVYNTVLSVISQWFPDRQGFISGFLLMGFGLGSMMIGSIFTSVTPDTIGGWRGTFMVFGIVVAAVIFAGSFFIVKPSDKNIVKYKSQLSKTKPRKSSADFTSIQMVKTPSFWMFFFWATFLSAAGLALISQATPFAKQLGPDVDMSVIAFVVGLISIFNGIGRVCFGYLFDKLGRKRTMQIITVMFILCCLMLSSSIVLSSFPMAVTGFICTGFCYGGITPTNSAFANSFFGSKHYPINYSIINLNLIIASTGSTIAGSLYDASGSYLSTFLLMTVVSIAALIISLFIRER